LLGSAVGFTIAQAFRDPTSSLTIAGTVIAITTSIITMFKFFSDYRKSMNIPSLEYGKIISNRVSNGIRNGVENKVTFLLEVSEIKKRGQKVNGCESFLDIPKAGVIHLTLFWRNGNRQTIPIGLKEEIQLFTFSSFITTDGLETEKKFLFFNESHVDGRRLNGYLSYGSSIDFEKLDINSEVIINMQVDTGGSAPVKPYRTTLKQILDTATCPDG
jgi:hypothetical protein